MIVGGILILGAIALIGVAVKSAHDGSGGGGSVSTLGKTINGIACEANEQTVVHYHAHLDLIRDGNAMSVPMGIGFGPNNACLYWLHTHDATGLIHIEAPASAKTREFTLGDLFAIWGQPLDNRHVGNYTLAPDETVTAYVDGVAQTGALNKIVMKAHGEIALEITVAGTPLASPAPSSFAFPPNT